MVSSATSTVPGGRGPPPPAAAALVLAGQRAGGVVEVGDDVGHPGRGVPQHLPPAVHVPAGRAPPPWRRAPAGRRPPASAAGCWRTTGDSTATRSPRPANSRQMRGDGAHRAGGHHDLLGHGRDPAGGVAVGERLRAARAARPGSRRGCGRTAAARPARPGRRGSARARARAGRRSPGRSSSRRPRAAAVPGRGWAAGCPPGPRSSCPSRAGTPGTPRPAAPRRRRRRWCG